MTRLTFTELLQHNIYQIDDGERSEEPISIMDYLNYVGGKEAAPVIDALMSTGSFVDNSTAHKLEFVLTKDPAPASESIYGIAYIDGKTVNVKFPLFSKARNS